MELLEHEKKHIGYLLDNAAECALFLKRDGNFPLSQPCKIALLGNGARNTIKGGTGSGDVASRFFLTAEEGLTKSGFKIVSTDWLEKFDALLKTYKKSYIKQLKKDARKNGYFSVVYSMGYFDLEREHELNCDYNADACIYVLARNSGEGNDRRNIAGDVKLTNKEIEDILFLNNKFEKFLLVLNVGGVVDLTPVLDVRNILLLSQLGVVTGDILANIVLGKANPSGKLTTTWAKPENYPFFDEFGDMHDTYYKEGIYVGYRYFSTVGEKPYFPFGYGLSYSKFESEIENVSLSGSTAAVEVKITNKSAIAGKEVVQAYISKPSDVFNNPFIELCGYAKTKLLSENELDKVSISFDLSKFAIFNTARAAYILPKGKYVVRVGNSSDNLVPAMVINVDSEVLVSQLENKCGNPGFEDVVYDVKVNEDLSDVRTFTLDINSIKQEKVSYKKDVYKHPLVQSLKLDDLINLCLGQHGKGLAAIIGESSKHVIGGAGETCLTIPEIKEYIAMADGPAGMRVIQTYGVDKKGVFNMTTDPLMLKMVDLLPKIAAPFILPPKHRKGEVHHQYSTALPIGTALAQSFNDSFVRECGNIAAEEMELFNVDLWLAPALNIHRNILCGRNFEYFSEDPLLSGKMAANITNGVQSHKRRGVTIKHYACNNQEFNRNNNNSHVSERALREIYLKGFEICVKESNPFSIMTSYNLLNGVHTSESYELINDILRCEWNYNGLVMSDWIQSGRSLCNKSIYPAPYASKNILAGNDLTMPGAPADVKEIKKALKKGTITREDLEISASKVYRSMLVRESIE